MAGYYAAPARQYIRSERLHGVTYRFGAVHHKSSYDFVPETDTTLWMLEPKMKRLMDDAEVLAKEAAPEPGRGRASAADHGGKPWRCALIARDRIAANMRIAGSDYV